MAKKHSSERAGFTLIEMVVVLGITTLFLMIGTFGSRMIAGRTTKIEESFFVNLRDEWQSAQFKAKASQQPLIIRIGDNRTVSFTCDGKKDVIKIPTTLSLHSTYLLKMNSNGNISPTTIDWYSTVGPASYRQTVQMGWGLYRVNRKVE
ncbi:prepilin-type N-terminal cleavage/methylation domain-containing protein [Secundilactobacillus malefermentans]|uniref:Prepilin-type N-terminal cleavage/methylation domain-containing protein n=1 Tax=Secundilactobacillus malefermentans TaxID=176292 RepID=A0A4R5NKC8_9LACO|nr:prepilin-type N-terminal cleavage/methylation domain-containing protein [Secundilactobacillus malefermentans]QEA32236.1 prepilin-type N-terminal cleavage/methylation domain-containing protein [Secundilactobacillus malefermentans]TDG74971.1 hypothetical protein C5L31_000490 [Secundilactobacillus malefermentans]